VRDRRLHRLFERFRKKGDVAALGKVFDAVAPELYRVAVHLARDLHTAEDLVQSTFLSAIESRDRWDAERPLVPWLLGILVRKAAYEHRSSARTPEHERLAPRSASEPVRESEAREVLEMHLCEEKSAAEIARDLGRAPGTVRVQIHRGLEMLRKNMPAGIVATGVFAALAPRGLAAVRGSVMSAAHGVAGPIAASAASMSGVVIGGLAMKALSISVAVVGAVFCALWFGVRSIPTPSSSQPLQPQPLASQSAHEHATESASLAAAAGPSVRAPASSAATPPERSAPVIAAPVPASDAERISVCGQFRSSDGKPAANAFVALLRELDSAPEGQPIDNGKCADDGSFCLHARPGAYFLVALADDHTPWSQTIVLGSAPMSLDPSMLTAGERIRGRVRLLGVPAPADCEVAVRCRVDGKAMVLGGRNLLWAHGKLLLQQSPRTKTDAQGMYACSGLDHELYRVSLESAPPARVLHASIDTEAPNAAADLDVDLARVVVHVRNDGQPAKARVFLTDSRVDATGRARSSHDVWGASANPDAEFLVPPGDDYRVDAASEGSERASVEFSVASPGQTIERTLELKRRSDFGELQVDLESAEARGIQRASFGLFATGTTDSSARDDLATRGMLGIMSFGGPTRQAPDFVRDEHAVDGVFHLRDVPAGSYDVVALPNSTWREGAGYWRHDPVHVDITAGGVARAHVDLRAAGRLRLRCDDPRGVHLPATCEVFDSSGSKLDISLFRSVKGSFWGGGTALNASAPDGANDVYPNLPEGMYMVVFSLNGYVDVQRNAEVKRGVTTEVVAVLEKK
jgi:RNA polymerase sigma-70 factor (ECF subfamily)